MVLRPDQRIADKLGVSQQWVTRIRGRLADDGNFAGTRFLPTSMQKDIARNLINSDNEFTHGDIADESGLSRKTVGKLARDNDATDEAEPVDTTQETTAESHTAGSTGETSAASIAPTGSGTESDGRSATQERRDIRHELEESPQSPDREVADRLDVDVHVVDEIRGLLDIGPGQRSTSESSQSKSGELETHSPAPEQPAVSETTPVPQAGAERSQRRPVTELVVPEKDLGEHIEELNEIAARPEIKTAGDLWDSLGAHMGIKIAAQDAQCPTCGSGPENLEWVCCGHTAVDQEIVDLASQAVDDHSGGDSVSDSAGGSNGE